MKRVPIQIRVPIISDKQDCCPYEKPFGYVYKITNKITGDYYIGKHEFNKPKLDKSYHGSGIDLQLAYKEYGVDNFETIILEWTNKNSDKLFEMEDYWVKLFHAYDFPNHYNKMPGGYGFTSEGTTGKNNPFYGKKHTEETKLKISRNNFMTGRTGKLHPRYGTKHTEETKQKIRNNIPDHHGKNNPNYGNHMSEKAKKAISDAVKGRFVGDKGYFYGKGYLQMGGNNPRAIPVVQLTLNGNFIAKYNCIKDSGFAKPDNISLCCKGKKKSYKGYKWMYLRDYLNQGGKIDVD